MGWIGVDLDGTLAKYDDFRGPDHVGEPIADMMARVRAWLAEGKEVKIFTARASMPELIPGVKAWLKKQGLPDLEVVCAKDFGMIELWDDRCVTVEMNTGRVLTEKPWPPRCVGQ